MDSTILRQAFPSLSEKGYTFFDEYPEIYQQLSEQKTKGDFSAEFTPEIVEIKYSGLTYLRYERGELTATRECSEGYVPPFWEVCFDEDETALFALGDGEVLLDRTAGMAELDLEMDKCTFSTTPKE